MSDTLGSVRAPAILAEIVRESLEPVLLDRVERLDSPVSDVIRHHFGWSDDAADAGLSNLTSAAKARHRLVPLLFLCSQVCGPAAVPWEVPAAAYTFMGNCALILDDILDNDRVRRGRPTAWARYGVPFAAQAGAALLGLAYEVLADANTPSMVEAARRMSVVVRHGSAAQLQDVQLEQRRDVSIAEAFAVAAAKTGAVVGLACTFGALTANAPAHVVSDLTRFGRSLGMIFQLVDDMDELWGDPAEHGQQSYRDLQSRKKTPVVVAALQSDTAAGAQLRGLFGGPRPLDDGQAARCAELVERCGGRDWTQAQVARQLAVAEQALDRAVSDPVLRTELATYARLLALAADGPVRTP